MLRVCVASGTTAKSLRSIYDPQALMNHPMAFISLQAAFVYRFYAGQLERRHLFSAAIGGPRLEEKEIVARQAKDGIYADQRIGEILRELPTRAGKRTDLTSSTVQEEVTKTDALKESGGLLANV